MDYLMTKYGDELEENGARAVSSFPRIVEVLYAMTASSGLQSVRNIAEVTGNSRSSVQRILRSLAETGYAEQRDDGSYEVGPRLIQLAARIFGAVPTLKLADTAMRGLVEDTGETCYLATYAQGDAFTTYIHRVESDQFVRHVQAIGVRIPLHAGAIGKAILAFSGIDIETLKLTKLTPNTLSKAALKKDLQLSRKLGYSTSYEERVIGVAGVAAPILAGDKVVGGLTVAIPSWRLQENGFENIGKIVRKRANELSLAMTATGVKSF